MTVVKHKIVIVIFIPLFLCRGTPQSGLEVGRSWGFAVKSPISVALQLSFETLSEFPISAPRVIILIPRESQVSADNAVLFAIFLSVGLPGRPRKCQP